MKNVNQFINNKLKKDLASNKINLRLGPKKIQAKMQARKEFYLNKIYENMKETDMVERLRIARLNRPELEDLFSSKTERRKFYRRIKQILNEE